MIRYLEEKEIIRKLPFDATYLDSGIEILSEEKIDRFIGLTDGKRGLPLSLKSNKHDLLTHLNLIDNNRVNNAAVLLFGKTPQKYFISSEVRCAYFHGKEIEKPILS